MGGDWLVAEEKLSILSMRFPVSYSYPSVGIIVAFNSLYEIQEPNPEQWMLPYFQLSILSMRFNRSLEHSYNLST